MTRPRVICLRAASVDGRIVVDVRPARAAVRRGYEAVRASCDEVIGHRRRVAERRA